MPSVERGAHGPPEEPALPAFLDVPRLELDQLLTQLVDRAQDVLAAQGRLRGLLAANRAIISDLGLSVVLRRIVEAACALVRVSARSVWSLPAATVWRSSSASAWTMKRWPGS